MFAESMHTKRGVSTITNYNLFIIDHLNLLSKSKITKQHETGLVCETHNPRRKFTITTHKTSDNRNGKTETRSTPPLYIGYFPSNDYTQTVTCISRKARFRLVIFFQYLITNIKDYEETSMFNSTLYRMMILTIGLHTHMYTRPLRQRYLILPFNIGSASVYQSESFRSHEYEHSSSSHASNNDIEGERDTKIVTLYLFVHVVDSLLLKDFICYSCSNNSKSRSTMIAIAVVYS